MQSTLSRRAVRAASSVSDEERHARRELAACYRLADRMGWSDLISAHISHRVPGQTLLQTLAPSTRLAVSSGLTLASAQSFSATVGNWRNQRKGPDNATPAIFAIGR